MSTRFSSHEQYIAAAAPQAQPHLQRIHSLVLELVPDAQACIGYNIPAFRRGKVFFYFAAFKRHIGVYPPVTGDAELQAELARYRGPKGNLSFPLDEPMPYELIGRVAVALAGEYAGR
ncbi:MAG: DUF1801 domain-containing protein [Gammaproteobacteria bacterium]|nr:DUF1801 domain-containing protein [Gammaproteobacteria bacterium]MBU1722688.1 DUF1801 domain-containing protein [Gammaproteobacteria bacterium]MBU2006010.1 DUF1801 domain-containing protein [Gammaproteobacteria bacterium]